METKVCDKCNESKLINEYYKSKFGKGGLRNHCKVCVCSYQKIKLASMDPESKKNKAAEYYLKNIEKNRKRSKIYSEKNRDKVLLKSREYSKLNRRKIQLKVNERERIKRKLDPMFRLRESLRYRISAVFRRSNVKKKATTDKLLGAPFEIVKKNIERQFVKGMSWENRKEWHIDHKIPLASAKTEEELVTLCHYTNLQPLWAKDNILKSDKIIPTQMKLTI